MGVSTLRTTWSASLGTGIAFCLCYETDEILTQEGKEPYLFN